MMAINADVSVRKIVTLRRTQTPLIDEWRARQRPIPNESESLRLLIDIGLKAEGIESEAEEAEGDR